MARTTLDSSPALWSDSDRPAFPIALDGGQLIIPGYREAYRRALTGGTVTKVTTSETWEATTGARVPAPWVEAAKDHGPLRWAYEYAASVNYDTKIWVISGTGDEEIEEDWQASVHSGLRSIMCFRSGTGELYAILGYQNTNLKWLKRVKPDNHYNLSRNPSNEYRQWADPWAVHHKSGSGRIYGHSPPYSSTVNFAAAGDASTTASERYRWDAVSDGSVNGLWVAYMDPGDDKLKLYRHSNVTTYTADLPDTANDDPGDWSNLFLARMPGGVGICLLHRVVPVNDNRPDIRAIYFSTSDNTFGSWVRVETNTDWDNDSDDIRAQVAWQKYPTDGTIRLAVFKDAGQGSSYDRVYLYEETIGNNAPTAPTVTSPASGAVADTSETLTLEWDFHDPDAGDSQSAYEVRRTVGTTVRYRTTTGWQADSDSSTKHSSTSTSLTLAASWGSGTDDDHHYAVRTWDQGDIESPWSAETRVIPSTPPARPHLTAPANNATITSSPLTVSWTGTQTSYRLRAGSGSGGQISTVTYDTGIITSTDQSHDIPIDTTPTTLIVEIRIYNSDGLESRERTRTVTVSLTPPKVCSPSPAGVDEDGLIQVTLDWTTATTGTTPDGGDIWRREGTDDTTAIRVAADVAEGTASWDDHLVASDVDYSYRVTTKKGNLTADSSWYS